MMPTSSTYLPSDFAVTDNETLFGLIRERPLATVVSKDKDGIIYADHIPLIYDEGNKSLRGHVAKTNEIWKRANDTEVLVIFRGPDSYISPSWYPSKQHTHKVVPTWNYAAVHMRGKLSCFSASDDMAKLLSVLESLTAFNEAQVSQACPSHSTWNVSDAPPAYIDQHMQAIMGIEIAVSEVAGKWKMSQNKVDGSLADVCGAVRGLRSLNASSDARRTADTMEGCSPQVKKALQPELMTEKFDKDFYWLLGITCRSQVFMTCATLATALLFFRWKGSR